MTTKPIDRERVEVETQYLAARALYTAAAAGWREGRVGYERVLDAFGHLARVTGGVIREAKTDEGARRFYREYVVGGVDREVRGLAREVSGAGEVGPVAVGPYVERGLGEWLLARDELARSEAALDERLHRAGASRYLEPATAEERRELALRTHAFEREARATGRPRGWTRETYDGLVGWTETARDAAFEVGYGPARDREILARGRLEAELGEHGEDVLVRLASGHRVERLPPAAVGLFVSAERGETDRVTGDAARAVLDEHVGRVVARVEAERRAVADIARERAVERDPATRALARVAELRRLTDRAADAVTRPSEGGSDQSVALERDALRRGPLGIE